MVRVSVEVRSGSARFRVSVRAPSIRRAASIVCTSSNAYKVKALSANPKVALTIDTEAPYRALLVHG